nr:hypothetical protein [Tanacetum cinerariifolium]
MRSTISARSAVVNSGNASIYSCISGHLALHVKVIKKDGLPWTRQMARASSKQLLHTAETIALPEVADCSDSVDHVFAFFAIDK